MKKAMLTAIVSVVLLFGAQPATGQTDIGVPTAPPAPSVVPTPNRIDTGEGPADPS